MDRVERELLEHTTRSEERWGEQWRKNERWETCMSEHDDRIDHLEGWRDRIRGQFAVLGFLGALAGGAVVALLSALIRG